VTLRVAVIEDNPSYRQSLETLFAHAPGFALAASYGSADAALDEVEKGQRRGSDLDWNIVVMDLDLPGTGGIEATRRFKADFPDLPIVVLTVFEEPTTILEAIIAGADGYLLKKSNARELTSQLLMIASGGSPLTAGVARTVLSLLRAKTGKGLASKSLPGRGDSSRPTRLDLTDREQAVLQCLVRGLSYKQCAEHLNISIDTVRTHIRAVYKKLQVHSVAEAVARAIRERLV
jgi:DNA-binding NarL/FixJ family response regulator